MKIVVDRDLCEANAQCVQAAPEVFRLDDADQLHVLVAPVPEALRAKVAEAIRRCPRLALSVED